MMVTKWRADDDFDDGRAYNDDNYAKHSWYFLLLTSQLNSEDLLYCSIPFIYTNDPGVGLNL